VHVSLSLSLHRSLFEYLTMQSREEALCMVAWAVSI
jgi:hypothetical protein